MANEVKIEDHTDELLKDLATKEEKALVMVGMQAEGDAKIEIESSPRRVDTGRLRNSITWAIKSQHSEPEPTDKNEDASSADGVNESQVPDDRSVIIGTNVEYACEIHEGRKGLDPNRFLRNAIEHNYETYRKMIDDVMKED